MARDADDSASRGERLPLGQVAVEHHAHDIAVVTLRGEHDLSTQPVLASALASAAAHSNVVVDLTECSFIDSMIIQEFIKSATTVRANGEDVLLVIPQEQPAVARIAEMVGLAQFIELHETKAAAFARIRQAERDRG